jgi:hypothetical protein
MMKLTTFLSGLPGVRPRLAGKQIKAGIILPAHLLTDLYHMYAALGPVTLIGPDAGEALRDLYNAGSLPMESWGSIQPTPAIDAYLADRALFKPEIAFRKSIAARASDTSSLSEVDLRDWHILELAFRNHSEFQGGTMIICGRQIEKRFSGRHGKPTGNDITFHWRDDAGDEQIVRFKLRTSVNRLSKYFEATEDSPST